MNIDKAISLTASKEEREAQRILDSINGDKELLYLLIMKKGVNDLLEKIYKKSGENAPEERINECAIPLLNSHFLDKKEKEARYLKFYDRALDRIDDYRYEWMASTTIPKLLNMKILDETRRNELYISFFDKTLKEVPKEKYYCFWLNRAIPQLLRCRDLPINEVKTDYLSFLNNLTQRVNTWLTKDEDRKKWGADWSKTIIEKLLVEPILTQEEIKHYRNNLSYKIETPIVEDWEKLWEDTNYDKVDLKDLVSNLKEIENTRYYSQYDFKKIAWKIAKYSQSELENKSKKDQIFSFEVFDNIDSDILEVLEQYKDPLSLEDIKLINKKWANVFLYQKKLKEISEISTVNDLMEVLCFDNKDKQLEEQIQYIKNKFNSWNKSVHHLSYRDIREKILNHPKKLKPIFDILLMGEKDCENQDEFWQRLAWEIFDKIDEEKIDEDVVILKEFIDRLRPSIPNKEGLRVFIAEYFNIKEYRTNKEWYIDTARVISGIIGNFFTLERRKKPWYCPKYEDFYLRKLQKLIDCHPKKLKPMFDVILMGEKDCEDQGRFWNVLLWKIFDKIDEEKIDEDVVILKEFIDRLRPSIRNKEGLRVFIAEYFNIKKYRSDKEWYIDTARVISEIIGNFFTLERRKKPWSSRKYQDFYSWTLRELIDYHSKKLKPMFDVILMGEKDCEDQERFWKVLLWKILNKIDEKRIDEGVNLLKEFIDKISPFINNRENLRIFMAYYFDINKYRSDKEWWIQTATTMINRPIEKAHTINENNFFKASEGTFTLCKDEVISEREPDFISYRRNRNNETESYEYSDDIISSEYRYTKEGVYRKSDHRGKVASCIWELSEENYWNDDESDEDDAPDEDDAESRNQYRNENAVVAFCPREKFTPLKKYLLKFKREDWDIQYIPTIPLQYLWKTGGSLAAEFGEKHTTSILDLYSPLDQHPNHYSDYITLFLEK